MSTDVWLVATVLTICLGAVECQWHEGPLADTPDVYPYSPFVVDCPRSTAGSSARFYAELVTPSFVPWEVREVCILLWRTNQSVPSDVQLQVMGIDCNYGYGFPPILFGRTHFGLSATLRDVPVFDPASPVRYSCVHVSRGVVWDGYFHLALVVPDSCGYVLASRRRPGVDSQAPQVLYWQDAESVQTVNESAWKVIPGWSESMGVALKVDQSAYNRSKDEVPSDWTACNASRYADGTCDCGCGRPDSDCLMGSSYNARGCQATEPLCFYGTCAPLAWVPSVDHCEPGQWGDMRNCSCGCMTLTVFDIDADCLNPLLPMNDASCPGLKASRCDLAKGQCEESWTCLYARYGDGRCDCNCGAPDPDCLANSTSQDCPGDLACLAARCVPRGWTCPAQGYNNSRACSCQCGVPDPDCASGSLPVEGCLAGMSCSRDGSCVWPGCGNNATDSDLGEQCDGGPHCDGLSCLCEPHFRPSNSTPGGCDPVCGDGFLVAGLEECENVSISHQWCNLTSCTCLPGHNSTSVPGICSGCGNGLLEPLLGESCDGGEGCGPSCSCPKDQGYVPHDPPRRECSDRGSMTLIIVVSAVLAALLVAIVALVLVVALFRAHRRRAPSTIPELSSMTAASGVTALESAVPAESLDTMLTSYSGVVVPPLPPSTSAFAQSSPFLLPAYLSPSVRTPTSDAASSSLNTVFIPYSGDNPAADDQQQQQQQPPPVPP